MPNLPTSQQKGNALENAVRAIETAVLRQSPGYDEKTFRIETKKRIKTKDGVPHEIDVWVTVEIAAGYIATYIFECKNWKGKVKKDQVSVFADKIVAAKAQKGFLVAEKLTRGALARLKSDDRMELLSTRELALEELSEGLKRFYGVCCYILETHCEFNPHKTSKKEVVDFETAKFSVGGQETDLKKYLEEWTVKAPPKTYLTTEGIHPFEFSLTFSADERAILNEHPVEQIKFSGKVRVTWVPGVIVTRFEVVSRGRVAESVVTCPDGTTVAMQELLLLSEKG
jgi:hypothetical protein